MDVQTLLTLIEHGGMSAVLFWLLMKVMARLDAVTDKLITIAEQNYAIQIQLADQFDKITPEKQ